MPLRTGSELPSLDGVADWINGGLPAAEELAGKPVLVHFWSVSCYICHDVATEVAKWQAEYGPRDLVVIGVHQPRGPEELDAAMVTEDARGPMGFTQRQGGGKFTRDEADTFIAQLQATAEAEASGDAPPARPEPTPRVSAAEQALRAMPAELLAAELQRRGWAVMEP